MVYHQGALFDIYNNKFDVNVIGMVNNFIDDTKIGGTLGSEEGYL